MSANQKHPALLFLYCYLPVLAVQLISAQITLTSVDSWYPTLVKPPWNPPGWLFGPAWTLLYLLMAIALWVILKEVRCRGKRRRSIKAFAFQLCLNASWTPVFFGMQMIGTAAIILAALVVAVGAMVVVFYRAKPFAAALAIPYFLWVCYALSLNAAIWWLN